MASLSLTAQEVLEVREMLGTRVTVADAPDSMIVSQMNLGAASDYVFERIRRSMDISKLPENLREIAERFADEQDDDIANFVNQVLKPPQRLQMRRAVMFRTAGNIVVAIQLTATERAGLVSETLSNAPTVASRSADWEQKRDHFYNLADDEIHRLVYAFEDDAFSSSDFSTVTYKLLATVGGS